MAPKKKEKSPIERLLENLKIKYATGQNTLGRVQTGYGYYPTKNASLNISSLITGSPVDNKLLIRKKDPAAELRNMTRQVGLTERLYNSYWQPRVKLAD